MKKLCIALIAIVSIALTSCTGDQGPPGPPGNAGMNGGIIVSNAFQIELDFNLGNNFEEFEPYGFEVFPTDVTLVYILWETINGQDVWRLLPQTVEFSDGTLTYNFDFTRTDVRFFLDGSTDFANLNASFTQNQIFRVVVIPADNVGRINYNDLDQVMSTYDIQTFDKR